MILTTESGEESAMKNIHLRTRLFMLLVYLWMIAALGLTSSAAVSPVNQSSQLDGLLSPPSAPELLVPADGATNQSSTLTFVWRSVPNAQFYDLQISTYSDFSMSFVNDTSITDTMRTVAGLPDNFTLFWRVNARNSDGKGPYSAVWSFRTSPPAIPGEVILSNPMYGAIDVWLPVTFSWNAPPGAISYQLQVSTDSLFTVVNYDLPGLMSTSTSIGSLAYSTRYYWRMRATGSGGNGIWSAVWDFTTVSSSPPPSTFEPVLYMPFDGNINDLSSARHYCWASERDDFVPDRFGREAGACGFNGYIGYVVINDDAGVLNFDIRAQSYTVSCWVKIDSLTPDQDQELIIDRYLYNVTPSSYDLLYQGSKGRFVAKCWDGTHYIVVPGTTTPVAGQWYHVAMVADTKRITLYVNGQPELSQDGAENADSIPPEFGTTRNIVKKITVGEFAPEFWSGHHYLHGAMDDLRIHNRALSAFEIDSLYQQTPPGPPPTNNLALYMPFDGTTMDVSGNGNTGTSGDPIFYNLDPWGHPGSAYSFQGRNLHVNGINVPNSASLHPTDALTIAFWIRLVAAPQSVWKLVSKSVGDQLSDQEYSFGMNVGGSIDTIHLSAAIPGGGGYELASDGMPSSGWYHFAAVIDRKDSHTMKLYINGILSKTVTDDAVGFVPNSAPLIIGMAQAMTSSPLADMDELRIYTRALSASEVNLLYRFVGGKAKSIFEASETQVYFGFVRLGESTSHDITLTNTSLTDTLHITAITNDNPDFSIGATPPLLITPGGNQVLHVVYTPTTVGIDTDASVLITVSNPGIPSLGLGLYGRAIPDSSLVFQANSGWNIISVPVAAPDNKKSTLFPTVVSQAYTYIGGYVPADTLITGMGYWMKFGKAEANFVDGNQLNAESISVKEGWNLIGSISSPVPATSITSDEAGTITSQFFGYGQGYYTSDTIQPGQGYWVKVDRDCKLVLATASAKSLAISMSAPIRIVATSELPPSAPDDESSQAKPKPVAFALNQNYPNPFNPTTAIQYSLPFHSRVSLRVYNLLGQVVQVLADGEQSAGYEQVEWNASDVASGVYFYRLDAVSTSDPGKTFTSVKKMLLIR